MSGSNGNSESKISRTFPGSQICWSCHLEHGSHACRKQTYHSFSLLFEHGIWPYSFYRAAFQEARELYQTNLNGSRPGSSRPKVVGSSHARGSFLSLHNICNSTLQVLVGVLGVASELPSRVGLHAGSPLAFLGAREDRKRACRLQIVDYNWSPSWFSH